MPNFTREGSTTVCDTCHVRIADVAIVDPYWGDQAIPEDADIIAAHPMQTERHDLYMEAMRLVGAKRSKAALVDLVHWLLCRIENP